jgi:hypothetical protein
MLLNGCTEGNTAVKNISHESAISKFSNLSLKLLYQILH